VDLVPLEPWDRRPEAAAPHPGIERLSELIERLAAAVARLQVAGAVPVRDKLLWGWSDIVALTGLSRRLLEREVSAGRMPGPDVKISRRRALFRPATITAWLESLAAQQAPGRRGRA
jgi:hypothetical protein